MSQGRKTRGIAGAKDAERKDDAADDGNGLFELVKSTAVAVVLFLLLRAFIIQMFVITSGSMEDTLLVGDMLVVNRLAIGSPVPFTGLRIPGYSEPHRGDVLVFDPPHEENLKLVKRLVGLPGDTLSMEGGVLYVDGQPQEEPYVKRDDVGDDVHPWMEWQRDYLVAGVDPGAYAPTRDEWGPLVVPEDRYFMLGDNRDKSFDSRYWGLLEGWRLEGRAILTYFSYNKGSYRPFPWIREVRWNRVGRMIR